MSKEEEIIDPDVGFVLDGCGGDGHAVPEGREGGREGRRDVRALSWMVAEVMVTPWPRGRGGGREGGRVKTRCGVQGQNRGRKKERNCDKSAHNL